MAEFTPTHKTILFEKDGNVVTLTLNRPQALNAFNTQMYSDLSECWQEVNTNPDIRVVIVTGAGRAFSAGKDLKEYVSYYGSGDPAKVRPVDDPQSPMFRRLAHRLIVRKPLIGALNGLAVGAGFDLFRICDIRIMAEDAWVGGWGQRINLPSGRDLLWQLPWAVANWMLLCGEKINAQQCLQWGLVTHAVPREELLPLARRLAAQVLQMGPDAVRQTKERHIQRQLEAGLAIDLEAEQAALRGKVLRPIENVVEGHKAWVERRKPKYKTG